MTLHRRKLSRSPSPTGVTSQLETERMLSSRTVVVDTSEGSGHLGITVSNDPSVGGIRVDHTVCADRETALHDHMTSSHVVCLRTEHLASIITTPRVCSTPVPHSQLQRMLACVLETSSLTSTASR